MAALATHEVTNQAPPLAGFDAFATDRALAEAVEREGAGWARDRLQAIGTIAGSADTREKARLANAHEPVLKTHDRYGNRVNFVEYHPAWHDLMKIGVEHQLHSLPWADPRPGVHVARGAAFYLMTQAEAGIGCPISATFSVIPALRKQPDVASEWEPRILSTEYDPRDIPATEKRGALSGMGMTEKQGGSDVRANTTVARPAGGGGPGGEYLITGHKWFFSIPMCDVFLVLAQADRGISCFLFPRWTPDGERNRFRIQRLKDKLGNRSNASSEVEFDGAWARLVGEEGAGVRTIIEMVNHTRLDCALGSAAGMRAALTEALNHTAHRAAFGKTLVDQPLMRNVLADLCVESEAATIAALRLARAYDDGDDAFKRVANPVLKYWICKREAPFVGEALECLGGNGYIEESGMPRLYKQAMLNTIWEGAGNIQCLDVLRAMRQPATMQAFFDEVDEAAGDTRLDPYVDSIRTELAHLEEGRARVLVERMAKALQASLLLRFGDSAVADAFCNSRLGGEWGSAFGTLPAGTDFSRILARGMP
jgi:putative acyl-CoA dehydrogenase